MAPTEPVTPVPLDGPAAGGASGGEAPHASDPAARTRGRAVTRAPVRRHPGARRARTARSPAPPEGAADRTTVRRRPDGLGAPGRHALAGRPARPYDARRAVLGEPVAGGTDRRRCQEVTVTFHNSGGTAVRSGSVTFGTHIIGAPGVDWGTVESTVPLPVPIAAGERRSPAWTVCVDAWRVPLAMRVETREVSADRD